MKCISTRTIIPSKNIIGQGQSIDGSMKIIEPNNTYIKNSHSNEKFKWMSIRNFI